MKKTLIALLALGSLAMAEEQALTLAPYAEVGVTQAGKGNSDGLVFTLKGSSERTQILNEAVMPATGTTVNLVSIEIANRPDPTVALGECAAVITDATGNLLGWSPNPTTKSVSHKNDWGLDYTRNYVTYSDFSAFDDMTPVTLTVGQEYHIYFASGDQQYDLMMDYYYGDGVMTSDFYTTVGFTTVDGTHSTDTARDYGFISGAGAASINMGQWAPAMGITVSYSKVPEPTTGTLSLLALAGLCIRRRK